MTFSSLSLAVLDLRSSLNSFVSNSAIGEITVRSPVREDDEISFMRLVVWSYALVFEAGRVTIPHLLRLPGQNPGDPWDPRLARQLVRNLRTWGVHNLGFENERDMAMLRDVQRWFVNNGGAYPPGNATAWRSCFLALCAEVEMIVAHCQNAMASVLLSADDGDAAIADLRRRIDRAWPAVEFHKLVGDAAIRLGISVDERRFSEPHLSRWRKYLESRLDGDNLDSAMVRMIERDLMDHYSNLLPIDGRDVMNILGLDQGPAVRSTLHRARELFRSGIRDREQLLRRLAETVSSVTR